jgi:hypothetical protein
MGYKSYDGWLHVGTMMIKITTNEEPLQFIYESLSTDE